MAGQTYKVFGTGPHSDGRYSLVEPTLRNKEAVDRIIALSQHVAAETVVTVRANHKWPFPDGLRWPAFPDADGAYADPLGEPLSTTESHEAIARVLFPDLPDAFDPADLDGNAVNRAREEWNTSFFGQRRTPSASSEGPSSTALTAGLEAMLAAMKNPHGNDSSG